MNGRSKSAADKSPLAYFLILLASLLAASSTAFSQTTAKGAPEPSMTEALSRNIHPPKFPAREFTITDFGAVADGKTACTEAIRKTIEACHKAGGGRVIVPKGNFSPGQST
jgi:polygalacturonase